MSPKVREWAKRQRTGSHTRKAVLMALADYADDQGAAIVKIPQIALTAELTRTGVQKALRQLEQSGLVLTEPSKPEGGRGVPNRFLLQV